VHWHSLLFFYQNLEGKNMKENTILELLLEYPLTTLFSLQLIRTNKKVKVFSNE